jgi:hypothetical protein
VPERIGSKVLPIPTKSQLSLWSQLEAVGEEQEPPRIYAGEVSGTVIYLLLTTLIQMWNVIFTRLFNSTRIALSEGKLYGRSATS